MRKVDINGLRAKNLKSAHIKSFMHKGVVAKLLIEMLIQQGKEDELDQVTELLLDSVFNEPSGEETVDD